MAVRCLHELRPILCRFGEDVPSAACATFGDVEPLPLSFHARDAVSLARALLGMKLVHVVRGRARVGRIVETEAYIGPEDLACHSSKGRTRRTEVMFGPAGHAYLFLVYGMHLCVNVVVGGGAAVLIRALEPGPGLADVQGLRTDGPGRLTRALGLSLKLNTLPLDRPPLFIARGVQVPRRHVEVSRRIGVDYAGEWASKPFRFHDRRSPYVSQGR
jgi:DNA-3-methyladenine glycosylase